MPSQSSQLLKLAELFLNRAVQPSARMWALGSLESLSQVTPSDNKQYEVAFLDLKRGLGYLGIAFSPEEWAAWVKGNLEVLNRLPNSYWDRDATHSVPAIFSGYSESRFFITTSPKPPDGLDVFESTFLRGIGNIPQLWVFNGEYTNPLIQMRPLAKEFAHYGWIYDSLSRITYDSSSHSFTPRVEKFISQNQKKIDSITRLFRIRPKLLGSGSDGVAWDIGDNRVLKVFTDLIAYDAAQQAYERLHTNPSLGKTEALIYDVGPLGQFDKYTLYYYIMEKMVPVSTMRSISMELRELVSKTVSKIYRDREFWRKVKTKDLKRDAKLIRDTVKWYSEKYSKELKHQEASTVETVTDEYSSTSSEESVPLSKNWLTSLVEEVIMKYLTGRTDLHMGNLGVTNYGEFRYFDPAYEGWSSNVNTGGGIVPRAEEGDIDWNEFPKI